MAVRGVPLVSIAITSYNYEKYVGRALRSAQMQAYPNLEIVVSDNASTDGSVAIISELAKGDDRVVFWVNETNIGAHANFDLVRERSKGDYVVFLSADDIFYPGHISAAMEYYAEHAECDLRHTAWTHIDHDGNTLMVCPHAGNRGTRSISARDEFAFGLTTNGHVRFQTVVFPRRVLDDVGEFSQEVLAADTEFLFRCARKGYTFAYDSRPFVGLLQHEQSASSRTNFRNTGKQLHDWLTIYDRNIEPETMPRLVGTRLRTRAVIENAVKYVQGLPEPSPATILEREAALLGRVREKIAAIPEKLRGDVVPAPRFTVVMPTVGRLAMLRRSIESVRSQTNPSWEIVVVGNGGRDVECAIREMSPSGGIVYAETLRSNSAGAARNVALRIARGETIAYLDEGDTWSPNYLDHISVGLDEHDADIVRCAASVGFYNVLEREQTALFARDGAIFAPHGKPFIDNLGLYAPLSAIAHRKYCYEIVGEFNEGLALLEDWEFVFRLIAHPRRFRAVDASGAWAETACNRGLGLQALGERLRELPDALNAVFAELGSGDGAVVAAREQRVSEIVAAAHALLADLSSLERLRTFVCAVHGYRNA